MRTTTAHYDLVRGIWKENPVLVQLLGLCPALAVTNTVANSIAMAAATFFVLLGSSILVSLLKGAIPHEVRISAYILIIATFVTIADMTLAAVVPEIHKALGAFIALIVVNCLILGRAEAFASKNTLGRSALDALGMGAGFTCALLSIGVVREVLGSGSLFGMPVLPDTFQTWTVMVLPSGGFFAMAVWLLVVNRIKERQAEAEKLAQEATS
jgi:electron transport complex protein RnfE